MNETTKLILNRIFAILTGVVAGALVIGLFETANLNIHPMPADLDTSDMEALKAHIATLPLAAFLFILAAHALGAIVGGFVASKMANVQKRGAALFVGLILVLAGVLNLMALPHPLWFSIADVLIYTPMALVGDQIRATVTKPK